MDKCLRERRELVELTMEATRRMQACGEDREAIREILDELPVSSMQLLMEIGLNATQDGKFDQAANIFELLTLGEPLNFNYWVGLGMAQKGLQDYAQAIVAFSMAQSLTFGNPLPSYYAALCYFSIEQVSEGLECLDRAKFFCSLDTKWKERLLPLLETLHQAWEPRAKIKRGKQKMKTHIKGDK